MHVLKTPLTAAAMAMAVALSACATPSEAPTAPADLSPAFAKPVSDPVVRLGMTVSDAAGNRLTSDLGGEYVDGAQTVTAQIDQFGNLLITVATSTTPARTLRFDYTAPVTSVGGFAGIGAQRWFKILSNKTNNNNPPIQGMTVGQALCYNVTIAQGDGSQTARSVFNPAADVNSTYARITRTTSASWTVESAGCNTTAANVATVSTESTAKNARIVVQGAYDQRFSMTLRALP